MNNHRADFNFERISKAARNVVIFGLIFIESEREREKSAWDTFDTFVPLLRFPIHYNKNRAEVL